MGFSTLKTEVESWLLDLPSGASTRVPGWVNQAVRDACTRHNFNFMSTQLSASTTLTTPNTSTLIARPSNWKVPRAIPYLHRQDGTAKELNWSTATENTRAYATSMPQEGNETPPDIGEPRYIHIGSTHLFVLPFADDLSDWDSGNYHIQVPYWGYPTDLSADSDTNWLTDNAPQHIIFQAVHYGFAWNRDEERASYFEAKAEKLFKQIVRVDKLSLLPPRLTLIPVRDVYAARPRTGLKV